MLQYSNRSDFLIIMIEYSGGNVLSYGSIFIEIFFTRRRFNRHFGLFQEVYLLNIQKFIFNLIHLPFSGFCLKKIKIKWHLDRHIQVNCDPCHLKLVQSLSTVWQLPIPSALLSLLKDSFLQFFDRPCFLLLSTKSSLKILFTGL